MSKLIGTTPVAVIVATALMIVPVPAAAATTVGETFVPTYPFSCDGPFEVLQTGRASGPSYAIPSNIPNGVLTSWSFEAGAVQTVMTLRVFRPTGTAYRYQVIADASELKTIPAASGSIYTFPANISVKAGDFIGIHSTSGRCASFTGNLGDTADGRIGTITDVGGMGDFFTGSGFIWDISAVVNPSNSFTLGKAKLNTKKGTATLTVDVPNPGELTGSGKGVKAAGGGAVISKTVTAPGPVKLLIKAKGKQQRTLSETGKVKLKPKIIYTPTGGDPSTQSTKLKLKKR